ncbi:MAG TPA: acyltransferase [Acidimicrobiales bacterium]|nr:acyltransferase [Acidimicrobiales bacterium]
MAAPGTPRDRSSSPARFPCFDGLRAFAALSVIVVHTGFASGFSIKNPLGIYTARADIGVSVFFLISGFLLYRPFAVAHLSGAAPPSTGRYLARRLLRIVPAYWAALTILGYGLHSIDMGAGVAGPVYHYLFLQIYSARHILGGITQAWSLCTEITFYLFLPLYSLVMSRPGRPPRSQLRLELSVLAAMFAFSVLFKVWLYVASPPMSNQMVTWLPAYLDLFVLGMALAVFSAWYRQTGSEPGVLRSAVTPWAAWGAAAGVYWLVCHQGISASPLHRLSVGQALSRQELYGLFALLLLLPAVFGPQERGLIRAALRFKPVAWIGVASYGVYLWHQTFVDAAFRWTHKPLFQLPFPTLTGITIAGGVAAGGLSYVLWEQWFLKIKPRRRREPGPESAPMVPAAVPVPVES